MSSLRAAVKKTINPLKNTHVLSSKQFDRPMIEQVLEQATFMHEERLKYNQVPLCSGLVLGNLFFEPSTRTATSFATAMTRLGGSVMHLDSKSSSAVKGETLEDTIRVMEQYTDTIVMRHPEVGSVAKAARVAEKPMLNAGDGKGEHPTQALLDLFTINQELGVASPDGLTVTFVGDLANGRTVHSLSRLLSQFDDVTVNYVSPDVLKMPQQYLDELLAAGGKNFTFNEVESYDDCMKDTNVLYMTRVQKERFPDAAAYEAVRGSYVVDAQLMKTAKPSCAVLHPLPRVDEISADFDSDPRAAYFRQMRNGLFARMALLDLVL